MNVNGSNNDNDEVLVAVNDSDSNGLVSKSNSNSDMKQSDGELNWQRVTVIKWVLVIIVVSDSDVNSGIGSEC